MPKQLPTTKLVLDALVKFPNSSKSSIATMLYENNKHLFNSVEHVRQTIKNYTTIGGLISKENKVYFDNKYTAENPFGLGYSERKEREFIKLPTHSNNILVISDIHFPNQDNKALTLALQYGVDNDVNCIIINGDLLDNEPFTNHDAPPPSKTDVVDWFEMAEDFLDTLIWKFPKANIFWAEGNHDQWFERYLMKKAPMLFNDEYFRMPQRLNLKEKGITYLTSEKILLAGKLQILHGHTLIRGMFSPVNPARGLFLRTKSSTLIGHVHTTSSHHEANLKGEIIGCYSMGCLCTLAPSYDAHNTKHNTGFAHVLTEKNGEFRVLNKTIIKGKIY